MKPGASDYVGHYVRAVYDFQTSHPREINLKKGDIIKVNKCIDSNWLHGINRTIEGNFPSSFVEKINLPAVGHGQKVFGATENFPAQQDGDLEFRKGTVIEGVEQIDINWWRGKVGSIMGIFPLTHVIELEVPKNLRDRASSVHSSEPMFARALCDSAAQLDEELGFKAGDIVTVTEIIDDDWYLGELGNKTGMFLSACVELIQDKYSMTESNQSKEAMVDNGSHVIAQPTATNYKVQDEGYQCENYADINANLTNQNNPDSSTSFQETQEYNTQFSYTNENTRSLESSISPYGMTLYPFYGESSNELSFSENEIVYLIQHVDPQWIEGQIDDKIGIFPASYVSIVVDCPYAYDADSIEVDIESESRQEEVPINSSNVATNEESSFSSSEYGLVLYDFSGEVDGDLTVFTGETVEIMKNVDDNWVQAKTDQGKVGMIPKQFLDIVSDLPPYSESKQAMTDSGFHSCDNAPSDNITLHENVGHGTFKGNDSLWSKQGKVLEVTNKFLGTEKEKKSSWHSECSVKDEVPHSSIESNSFKKPALPSKPKPNLAPKPILKPKPVNSQNKHSEHQSLVETKPELITKSLSFRDDKEISKSASQQIEPTCSDLPSFKSSSQLSKSSKLESDLSKDSSKAFGEIDSMVRSEIRKEIRRSDTLPTPQNMDDTNEDKFADLCRPSAMSSTKVDDRSSKKRHSVNFPLTSSLQNTSNIANNRESICLSQQNTCQISVGAPVTKVGYSTFFTDITSGEPSSTRPVPMRKPPPPPQKSEALDFSRKPSLRKPPPPRPSVPRDQSLSPPKTLSVSSPPNTKSKKSQKEPKDQSKIPRQHIKPTRPAPQRPVPGQVPSRPPTRPPTSGNLMSFSPTEAQEDTNVEIIEDLKQRIKEVETDLQKYKKCKEELEFSQRDDDPESHDNIEFYTANIDGLTMELESLKENLHKVLPSAELDEVAKQMEEEERLKEEEKRREEDKNRAEEERKKRRDKRERVIEELIQTERDFLHCLHLCIETFIGTSDKHFDVDVEAVFGNIEDVADVSQRLLTLLENAVNGKDFEEQLLGPCFTQLCEDMKNAYAPYCRNHDEVIAVLEKYYDDPSIKQYFDKKLNELRGKIVVFDLEALLIKPVQRILKYPLLLNELIKSTEDSHEDKVEILNGINAMTDVATAINEYKRRKDLVYKYKRETDQSLGDMLSKMTLHSLKKKGSRFKGRLSTNLGIAPQTKDEDFDKVETKFREMEKTVKLFTKNVQTYVDQLQEAFSCHEGVVIDLTDYYDDKPCPEIKRYQQVYQVIQQEYLVEFTSTVKDVVIAPLNKLIVLFNGPNKVIQKRFDKLLDFDSMQRKEEKGSEKSVQVAKSNYLALNAQLLDELPKMYSLSFNLLQDCICTFIRSQRQFYSSIMDSMTEILDMSLLIDSEGTVVDNFNIKHTAMIDKMSLLRIIPRGFNPKMDTLGKPVVGKTADKKSKRMSLQDPVFYIPAESSAEQSDSQRAYIRQKYPDKVYQVTLTYQASEMMDLSVSEGMYVGLVMDKDPMGNKERWFVDNGATKGFVPKTVLILLNTSTSTLYDRNPTNDQLHSDVTSVPIGQKSPQTSPQISVSSYSIEEESLANPDDDELEFALDEDMSPNISSEEFYYAAYSFEARNSNELSLFEGQVVTVLNKHDQENNPEWWFVDADGVKGYAPANYLRPMR